MLVDHVLQIRGNSGIAVASCVSVVNVTSGPESFDDVCDVSAVLCTCRFCSRQRKESGGGAFLRSSFSSLLQASLTWQVSPPETN